MSSRILPFLAALGSLVVACSGATTGVNNGSNDGGTSSSSSSSGGGGGCTIDTLAAKRVCVPGTAKAGVPITLQAEADGCLGCGTTLEPCKVDVQGNAITIGVEAKSCPLPADVGCPAVCGIPQVTCTLPALTPGTYTVTVEKPLSILPARELVVTADATDQSCALTLGATEPPPLSASDYSTACSVDGDCVLVQAGSACAACACQNAAIAKSSQDAYDADKRARASQCPPRDAGIACAPCIATKAKCDAGTCKAVPVN